MEDDIAAAFGAPPERHAFDVATINIVKAAIEAGKTVSTVTTHGTELPVASCVADSLVLHLTPAVGVVRAFFAVLHSILLMHGRDIAALLVQCRPDASVIVVEHARAAEIGIAEEQPCTFRFVPRMDEKASDAWALQVVAMLQGPAPVLLYRLSPQLFTQAVFGSFGHFLTSLFNAYDNMASLVYVRVVDASDAAHPKRRAATATVHRR